MDKKQKHSCFVLSIQFLQTKRQMKVKVVSNITVTNQSIFLFLLLWSLHLCLLDTTLSCTTNKFPIALLVLPQLAFGNKMTEQLLGTLNLLCLSLLNLESLLEFPVLPLKLG